MDYDLDKHIGKFVTAVNEFIAKNQSNAWGDYIDHFGVELQQIKRINLSDGINVYQLIPIALMMNKAL